MGEKKQIHRNTFRKAERLNSHYMIDELFRSGRQLFVHPFKVIYKSVPISDPGVVKVLLVVPKKQFRHAVDRNHIKRLIREVYRKNKHELWAQRMEVNEGMLLGLIYVGKTIPEAQEVERKLILILQRLLKKDEEIIG